MRKTLLMLVMLLLPTMVWGEDWASVYRQLQSQEVVRIQTSEGFCTGVMLKVHTILTAAHCFRNNKEVVVLDHFGQERSGLVFKVDPLIDLALVDTDTTGLVPIRFAVGNPEPGTPVLAVGFIYPSSTLLDLTPSYVILTGTHITITNPLKHGYSGGPLVNQKGELVGIDIRSNDVSAIAVSSIRIQKFLDRAAEGRYGF